MEAVKALDQKVSDLFVQHLRTPKLNQAGPAGMRQREHGREVQVVAEDDVAVGDRPVHDLAVRRRRISDLRSVDGLESSFGQNRYPLRREIDIDDQPQGHAAVRSSSRSSRRQAA